MEGATAVDLLGCHHVPGAKAHPGHTKDSANPQEALHHTLPKKLGGSLQFWSKGWRPLEGV